MNKLKKSLALVAVLAIASTAFVACGGDSSSSTADSSSSKAESSDTAESSDNGGESSEDSGDNTASFNENLKDDGDVLSFLCWTGDDVNAMIANFTDNTDYTTDQVKWVQVGEKGQEAREKYATYFAGDEDVDLFVMEADWILDYINNDDYTAPLTWLGFDEADFNGCYQYTLDVGTDNNGVLKGVSWQATPGCYAYRTDLAESLLGATTPDEMQEYVKDWDTFTETAKKVAEDSNGKTAMADTLGGMWQVWQYNRANGWVDSDDKLVIDDFCKEYAELAKAYYDNGYVTKESQWTDGWYQITQDDSTMGAFICTWCFGLDGTLSTMEGNSKSTDGTPVVDGKTGGKYNVCAGPSGWAWGGSWFGLSPKCDNATIAHDFVNYFTVDEASIENYALYKSEFVNNPTVMKKIVDDKSNSNAYLGGQDQFSILYSAAGDINMGTITAYDSQIKDCFNSAVSAYVTGTYADYDAMIEGFKKDVASKVEGVTVE